jgi:hypothetical protein
VVPWWGAQIIEVLAVVNDSQFSIRSLLNLLWQLSGALAVENLGRFFVFD